MDKMGSLRDFFRSKEITVKIISILLFGLAASSQAMANDIWCRDFVQYKMGVTEKGKTRAYSDQGGLPTKWSIGIEPFRIQYEVTGAPEFRIHVTIKHATKGVLFESDGSLKSSIGFSEETGDFVYTLNCYQEQTE